MKFFLYENKLLEALFALNVSLSGKYFCNRKYMYREVAEKAFLAPSLSWYFSKLLCFDLRVNANKADHTKHIHVWFMSIHFLFFLFYFPCSFLKWFLITRKLLSLELKWIQYCQLLFTWNFFWITFI